MPASAIGAEITGKLASGQDVTLRLEGQETFTSANGKSLRRYTIGFTIPGSNEVAHVCGLDAGQPVKAIPLSGWWDYSQGTPTGGSKTNDPSHITFACHGYALYKCVDHGYRPWDKNKKKQAEAWEYHQTCTRMIRADYCGDGEPWTVNGTIINLYDNIGIQNDTESWPIEAEWSPDGARCLSHQRLQNLPSSPQCAFELPHATCGAPPSWGDTLLVSEAP